MFGEYTKEEQEEIFKNLKQIHEMIEERDKGLTLLERMYRSMQCEPHDIKFADLSENYKNNNNKNKEV